MPTADRGIFTGIHVAAPLFADPIDAWKTWFAWHPVKTANAGWVWLRQVYWRPCVVHAHLDPNGGDVFWQFWQGPLPDVR